MILVFLAFVLGVVQRETLDFGPEKLAQEAQDAKRHLDEPWAVEVTRPDFTGQAEKVREPIPDRHYPVGLFNPPVFTRKQKRTSPNVTLVSDLRSSGHGALDMQGDEEDETGMTATGRGTRGQDWVSVLGVIQNAEQIRLFKEAFENSDYTVAGDSTPEYIYAYVKRAEIDPQQGDTAPAAALKWKGLPVRKALKVMEKWLGQGKSWPIPRTCPRTLRSASRPARLGTVPGGPMSC